MSDLIITDTGNTYGKSVRIKEPKIVALALVGRGANRVNRSILKGEKAMSGKIFKEETADETSARLSFDDIEDLKKSADILTEVSEIYLDCKDERTKNLLGELLTHYEKELPEVEKSEDDIPYLTAEDFLKKE